MGKGANETAHTALHREVRYAVWWGVDIAVHYKIHGSVNWHEWHAAERLLSRVVEGVMEGEPQHPALQDFLHSVRRT